MVEFVFDPGPKLTRLGKTTVTRTTAALDRASLRGRWPVPMPASTGFDLAHDRGPVTTDPPAEFGPADSTVLDQCNVDLVAFAQRQRCSWHPGFSNGRGLVQAPASCREPCTDRWNWPTLAGLVEAFEQIPAHLRRSVTFDQGVEWAQWETLATTYALDVYFCDPHSPWQRGQIENLNRQWRWWFPRGTDLAAVAQADADHAAGIINEPRRH